MQIPSLILLRMSARLGKAIVIGHHKVVIRIRITTLWCPITMALPNLADILSKINDGICILDNDGEVTFANNKASEILETADQVFQSRIAQALKDRAPVR